METCLVFCHFSTEVNCVMIREGFSGASGGPSPAHGTSGALASLVEEAVE